MLIDKLNGFLNRFVGPNAAHTIDALIGVALVGAVAFASSAPARLFLLHHALLGVLVSAGVPLVTALASKFRKAAGSTAPLVDQLTAAIVAAIPPASPEPPAKK
jgi:hypothetical protein